MIDGKQANCGSTSVRIFVDADACPVKAEILRVAERHALTIYMVSNSWMRLDDSPLINRVIVDDGPDAADDWIAEQIGARDIAITQDIPLADRCLKKGAKACVDRQTIRCRQHWHGPRHARSDVGPAREWRRSWEQSVLHQE